MRKHLWQRDRLGLGLGLRSCLPLPGGIDGYEISREALRIDRDVKILMTSGYASERPVNGEVVSEVPIMYKPYHRSQLLTKIEEILAGP